MNQMNQMIHDSWPYRWSPWEDIPWHKNLVLSFFKHTGDGLNIEYPKKPKKTNKTKQNKN